MRTLLYFTLQVMFEKFKVLSLYLATDAAMALMASGRTAGLVVDCGRDKCTATPVYELHPIPHASRFTRMSSAVVEKYTDMKTPINDLREMIKTMAQIQVSAEEFTEKTKQGYPNKQQEKLARANEAFFQPKLLQNSKEKSLPQIVINAVEACDPQLKKELLGNVILCGGGSMVPGLSERLQNELTKHYKSDPTVKIIAPPERVYSTWIGGSTQSILSYFPQIVITQADYEECGPYIARRKCFVS